MTSNIHLISFNSKQLVGLDESKIVNFQRTVTSHLSFFKHVPVQIHTELSKPLEKLCEDAQSEGIQIALLSGYRSYSRQSRIWQAKINGDKPIYDKHQQIMSTFEDDYSKYKSILNWSALPGASRHHWGTDIDIFDADVIQSGYHPQLLPQEFTKNGVCYKLAEWMNTHLDKSSFHRPYLIDKSGIAIEPWHISYSPLSELCLKKITPQLLVETWQNHPTQWTAWAIERAEEIFQTYVMNNQAS